MLFKLRRANLSKSYAEDIKLSTLDKFAQALGKKFEIKVA